MPRFFNAGAKRNLIIFFLFLFFLTVHPVHAQTPIKHAGNPLPFALADNIASIFQNHVFIKDSKITGVFSAVATSGKYVLVYAESPNGINWSIKNTILEDDSDLFTPFLYQDKDTGGNILFFSKIYNNSLSIFKTQCDSNLVCSENQELVMAPGLQDWSKYDVASPFVIKQNGIFYLFYTGWKRDEWKIGMAYSTDGTSWITCSTNPLISPGDGPFITKGDTETAMYFHLPNATGIRKAYADNSLGCDTTWTINPNFQILPDKSYDMRHIISPSVISKNSQDYIYYSGLGENNTWSLNLYSPEQKIIVFLPGFLGSWNYEALITNTYNKNQLWSIPDFITEYSGILNTFKNIGLVENQDYFIFGYDWRKRIQDIQTNLDNYMQQTVWSSHPGSEIYLVGHSLGGLIARIWAQDNPGTIKKLITVGAPNNGLAQVYKPLMLGLLEKENTLYWLGQKLFLMWNKNGFENDKETIRNTLPVLFDLYPTFPFLYINQQTISDNEAPYANTFLKNKNKQTQSNPASIIYGVGIQSTQTGFDVEKNPLTNIFSPIQTKFGDGDGLVAQKYATIQGASNLYLPLNHRELVYTKTGIQTILDELGLIYNDSQIIEGKETSIYPVIIALFSNTVNVVLKTIQKTTIGAAGMAYVANPGDGEYTLSVQGRKPGAYTVLIGHITQDDDAWEYVTGTVPEQNPTNYLASYYFSFNSMFAASFHGVDSNGSGNQNSNNSSGPTPTQGLTLTPTPTETPTPTYTPTPTLKPTIQPSPTPTTAIISKQTTNSMQSPQNSTNINTEQSEQNTGSLQQSPQNIENLFPVNLSKAVPNPTKAQKKSTGSVLGVSTTKSAPKKTVINKKLKRKTNTTQNTKNNIIFTLLTVSILGAGYYVFQIGPMRKK